MDVVQKYATTLGYKKPCMKIRQPVGSGMDMQEEAGRIVDSISICT